MGIASATRRMILRIRKWVHQRRTSPFFTADSGIAMGVSFARFNRRENRLSRAILLPKPTCRNTTRTNITIKFWVSQFAVLLWGSRLHGFVSHRFFARIFCTDFLHGFFARIFCTDFLHGFFARIFCTDFLHVFCPIFLRGFLHGLLARIVCTDVARIFARIFLGCPKTLAGKRQNFTEKIPRKIHHALGAFWGGAREAGG